MIERRIQMRFVVVAIIGAGAAARAAWGLMKAYDKLTAVRDELDDSLHTHQKENASATGKP